MTILAIDTATRWTGLALHNGSAILAETGWFALQKQTVELAPATADLMKKAGVSFDQLDAVAIAIGPGSYTGLRIGLAFAKGIALAHQIPLIGVSTLDVLALSAGEPQSKEDYYLIPIAEAGRTRVCSAVYRWYARKGWQVKKEPDIYTWADLIKTAPSESRFIGEIPEEIATQLKEKGFRPLPAADNVRRAGQLAQIAVKRFKKDDWDDADSLVPTYLRDPA